MTLLNRISARYPGDVDALGLAQACRTMLEIRSAAEISRNEMPDLRLKALLAFWYGMSLHRICDLFLRGLSLLPGSWRKWLGYSKWETWKKNFSKMETSYEKFSLNILLCDPLRRKIVFSILGGLIALGLVIIVSIAWPTSRDDADRSDMKFHAIHQKARNGDAQSQYRLGAMYYRGTDRVSRDIEQSHYWLSLAAQAGHEDAARLLAKVNAER